MEIQYDILIIGAGISGIGMACHLSRQCPGKRVAILERREAIGGTWDLFRYPGIRSDSDMMTFGYQFRPWTDTRTLADGPAIRHYVKETAREYGVDKLIQFDQKVTRADWSSQTQSWTLTTVNQKTQEVRTLTCRYLIAATGYYNYDQGYLPDFPGIENFKGQCIHPQHWPQDLDYRDKRVIVIGSGATAVTLIPAMAGDTTHITMLQRSPTYLLSLPSIDRLAVLLSKLLPTSWVYAIARTRNVRLQRLFYKTSRRFPKLIRRLLLSRTRKELGKDVDMRHFTPHYMPWDERVCAVSEGDLFQAVREGKASIVTDHIERFTEKGILLKSGKELEADIIVTATGLEVQVLGGTELSVDSRSIPINQRMTYKGVLIQDVPNLAYLFGYTNLSWTMKIDLAADYVCRLINEMDRRDAAAVIPRAKQGEVKDESIMAALKSGYVQRADGVLPRQGKSLPWRVLHDYDEDRVMYRQSIDDEALEWITTEEKVESSDHHRTELDTVV